MDAKIHGFRGHAKAQAEELLAAIAAAEMDIVTTIERECEALRAGRMLAAKALHTRLGDAARLYMSATKAARASLWTIEHVLPGSRARLDEGRAAFSAVLQVELAVLAAVRAAAGDALAAPTMAAAPAPRAAAELRPSASGRRAEQRVVRGSANRQPISHLQVLTAPAPRRDAG